MRDVDAMRPAFDSDPCLPRLFSFLLPRRITSVEASEQMRASQRHDQSSQACGENVNRIVQIEIADLAYEQITDCDIERTPQHIHSRR
jgi:hypothetical protein